jgi:hypothetical protein
MWALAASLLCGYAWAADWPAGSVIDESIALQVGEDGLLSLGDVLPAMIPTEPTLVDDVGDKSGCLYMYELSNLWAQFEVVDAVLVPLNGSVGLDMDLVVWINDETDKFTLAYELLCIGEEVCPGYVTEFDLNVKAPIIFDVVTHTDGKPLLVASVGKMNFDSGLNANKTKLSCTTGVVEDVLGFFGLNLYDLILQQASGPLKSQIEDQLNDALLQARFEDSFDLLGTELSVAVYPFAADATTDGLEIVMSGWADAAPDTCVAEFDEGEFAKTDTPIPDILELSASGDIAALLADDFINELLYAVWSGGVLCYQIDETFSLGGLAVDTALLELVGREPYEDLVPAETGPLIIRTVPTVPLTVNPTGDHDLDVRIEDLEVNFYSELDGRVARTLAIEIDADVGVDFELDGSTGQLAVLVDLSEDAFSATVGDDVMVASGVDEIAAGFEGVMGTLIESVVGPLLGDAISLSLPNMGGVGLTALTFEAAGDDEDWVAGYVTMGPVTYGDPDAGCACDEEGGCSSEEGGCDSESGCSFSNGGASWLFVLVAVGLRRRER